MGHEPVVEIVLVHSSNIQYALVAHPLPMRKNRPTFWIYNTLTRQKEAFVPLMEEGKRDDVGIYTCGPTVYSEPHVGNMKPYVFADLLR